MLLRVERGNGRRRPSRSAGSVVGISRKPGSTELMLSTPPRAHSDIVVLARMIPPAALILAMTVASVVGTQPNSAPERLSFADPPRRNCLSPRSGSHAADLSACRSTPARHPAPLRPRARRGYRSGSLPEPGPFGHRQRSGRGGLAHRCYGRPDRRDTRHATRRWSLPRSGTGLRSRPWQSSSRNGRRDMLLQIHCERSASGEPRCRVDGATASSSANMVCPPP